MDRRKFLSLIPIGITVAVVAPKLLIPKEPVKIAPMQIVDPINWKNTLSTARLHNYDITRPKFILLTGKQGMEDFHSALHDYYKHMDLTQFLNHVSK